MNNLNHNIRFCELIGLSTAIFITSHFYSAVMDSICQPFGPLLLRHECLVKRRAPTKSVVIEKFI